MTLRLSIVLATLAAGVACERGAVSPASEALTPAGPSAVAAQPAPIAPMAASAAVRPSSAVQGRQDVVVNMADACDPDTFNAAIGPNTCLRNGGVQFDQFIATLTRLAFIGPWHFAPNNANVRVGQSFAAVNRGGEVHTFTEVAQFGGGIVPLLNEITHQTAVAPECAHLDDDDFVAPGATYREEVGHAGKLKFQCCIHPWMKLEADAAAQ
jgi:plastocyanin